jgi:hypothetical protein
MMPGPMSEILSWLTVTEADFTLLTTIRIAAAFIVIVDESIRKNMRRQW